MDNNRQTNQLMARLFSFPARIESSALLFRRRGFQAMRLRLPGLVIGALIAVLSPARGDAMLELFQQTWPQISQSMPEIAEAGYDSLWLPNPAKGNSGAYSVGYDVFDPFDLGSTNQQGTVATFYGTQAQLIQMVQTAHRFGIRVYFDNVMNHRASTVPGYPGSGTPTNYYPGPGAAGFSFAGGRRRLRKLVVRERLVLDSENVENNPLLGLCDLANEPGTVNWNFGPNYGDTTTKPVFVRFPGPAGFVHGHQRAFARHRLGRRGLASLRRPWPAGGRGCLDLSLPRGGVDAVHDQVRRFPAGRGEACAGGFFRQRKRPDR